MQTANQRKTTGSFRTRYLTFGFRGEAVSEGKNNPELKVLAASEWDYSDYSKVSFEAESNLSWPRP